MFERGKASIEYLIRSDPKKVAPFFIIMFSGLACETLTAPLVPGTCTDLTHFGTLTLLECGRPRPQQKGENHCFRHKPNEPLADSPVGVFRALSRSFNGPARSDDSMLKPILRSALEQLKAKSPQ